MNILWKIISYPLQSSDTLFTAEGLGGSATSSAGGGSFETGLADGGFTSNGIDHDADETMAWNRNSNIESCDNNVDEVVCPYATFQLSRDQQLQLQQHQQQVQLLLYVIIDVICNASKVGRLVFLYNFPTYR